MIMIMVTCRMQEIIYAEMMYLITAIMVIMVKVTGGVLIITLCSTSECLISSYKILKSLKKIY